MTSALLAAAEEEHANELLFEPLWFGVIAFVVMMGLLALLWSFRNTLLLDPVAHDGDDVGGTDAVGADPNTGRGSHH